MPSTDHLCQLVRPLARRFDAEGIAELLTSLPTAAVLRMLERRSSAVVQLIGPLEVADAAMRMLDQQGIRRIPNLGAVPEEIARFPS